MNDCGQMKLFGQHRDKAKVYPLLETDDMIKMGDKPDWKCVYTYVQALYRGLKPFDPTQK